MMTPLLLAEYAKIARTFGMSELHLKLGLGDEFRLVLTAEGPPLDLEKAPPEEPGRREAAELLGVSPGSIRMPQFSTPEGEE